MKNISFKANLIVNDNLYKKMPKGTPDGYMDNLIENYKKFLDNEYVKAVTQGDTIELYKAPYNRGFALGIRYTSDKLKEPIESGIFTNKKIPDVTVGSIIFQTMLFVIEKAEEKVGFSRNVPKVFVESVKKLYQQSN